MIVIQKRPYEYNFTGNPIIYQLFDNDATADATLSFQVKVLFIRLDGSVYSEISTLTVSPYQGVAQIDISSLLHIQLEHYVPPVENTPTSYSSGTASLQFYIHFRTISNTNTSVAWNTTEENYVRWGFKGGLHNFRFRGNAFFTQYVTNQKPFYTWQVRNRLAALNERIYLSWVNLLFNILDIVSLQFKVLVTYTDQTTAATQYSVTDLNKGFRFYFSAGATQLALADLNPSKTIWYWQCWLEDVSPGGVGIITEKFTYVADNRNDYNNIQIIYRNSLGSLDTVRVRGILVKNLDYQSTITQRSAAADYPEADQLPALLRTEPAVEQLRYKAELGYLGKDEQDRLRDALLNREAYMEKYGRLFPLNIVQGGFEMNRSDAYKWSMPIEFTLADDGSEYYTPDNIDLGDADPNSNVCSSFIVISGYTLLVNTPSAGLTTARLSYAVSGSGTGLQWRVPGFQDVWQDIAFAASGTIDYAVSSDVEFNFEMRVKCSEGNFGAFTSHFVDTDPTPPVANSTIYNETWVDSTFTVKVNGTAVATGTVAAGGYSGFYLGAYTGANIEVVMGSISPMVAELFIIDTIYLGSVSGNTASWGGRNTTTAGVTVTIR